ncbi:MAG: HEAT repeat domain-containing protein [Planctomycetota bacterium]
MQLRAEAVGYLKAGLQYAANPAVRIEAVEGLRAIADERTLPWLRTALLDEHAAVRFAACLALGELRDAGSAEALRKAMSDANDNVRIAATFARHRLGHAESTGKLATYLLHGKDPSVRRNAAMALGRLGEVGAVKVLARAVKDSDAGVRHQALEALARLGNSDARQELAFMTNAGVGSDEVFALNALADLHDRTLTDTFRYKLATAVHLETKLAAARGLGLLGDASGLDLALRALRTNQARVNDPDDPPEGQVLRTRQLAAAALGAIGRRDALGSLAAEMRNSSDPRIQVSGAKAVLEILDTPLDPFTKPTTRDEAWPGDLGQSRGWDR